MKRYTILIISILFSCQFLAAKLPTDQMANFLQDHRGRTAKIEDINSKKLVGFYFSAGWCSHCRTFTPELVKFYQRGKQDMEIILVSKDKSEKAQQEYIRDFRMQWKAAKWDSPLPQLLRNHYDAEGIPTLIVVDAKGNLITRDGVKELTADPRNALQNWLAKAQ